MGAPIYLTHENILGAADLVALRIKGNADHPIRLYGVPRGGIPAAYVISCALISRGIANCVVDSPETADIFIDDIIDSGATKERYAKYGKPFYALYDKGTPECEAMGWLVFPWEATLEGSIEDVVTRTIEFIGDDPKREGLLETPKRVVKAWHELFRGYKQDPESVFKVFDGESCDQLVLLRDVEIYSMCEHHMLPFTGRAHIAYIPDGKVIGVSKLARLMDIFSRRLQIQERIGEQITEALMIHLAPRGAACIIEAKHLCLAGDSLVQLAFLNRQKYPKGIPIKDLVGKQNLQVYCYNKETDQIDIGNVSAVWKSGRKKVYRVSYEWFMYNQHKKEKRVGSIKVSEEHPFMLRHKAHNHSNNKNRQYMNGSFLSIKEGLAVGDSLMPFSCYEAVDGYYTVLLNNGKSVQEHRFLLEHKLGRALTFEEVCHHDNECPTDNSFGNLTCFPSRGEHSAFHSKGKSNPNKSHVAHNKKARGVLVCENCGEEFTAQFAYQEKTQRFCTHSCYLEMRYANHSIVSIEEVGVEDVYDMEVEKHHNFAVNDVIVHNCMSARGANKQHSIMVTSSMRGVFREDAAARSELMQLIRS